MLCCQSGFVVCVLFHSAGLENDNKGNKLNGTKAFAVEEKEKSDILYREWEEHGRSWDCRIWIGVCVWMLCLRSSALGTGCLALQVCAGGCRGLRCLLQRWLRDSSNDRLWRVKTWAHVCVCGCRQVLAWLPMTYTHTNAHTQGHAHNKQCNSYQTSHPHAVQLDV